MIDNLVEVFDLNFCVPAFLGIEHDVWSFLAGAEAHIRFNFDIVQPLGSNSFLELRRELFRAAGLAIDILTN